MRALHAVPRFFATSVEVLLATLLLIALISPTPAYSQEAGRTIIPVTSQWPGARPAQIDITDDGRHVVYQANRGDGWKLFIHELGQSTSRELDFLGNVPYFGHVSPDGDWLLFGKKGWIWKAPLAGGEMVRLTYNNNFTAWETDEAILVAGGSGSNVGMYRIEADGSRQSELIAPIDPASGATNYGRPSLLPGGRGVLLSVGFGTGVDRRKIGVVSLPSGRLTIIDEYGINPRYADSGHILYTQGSTLKAIPFDLDRLQALGEGVTVVEGVWVFNNQASQFDISRNGILVYVPGSSYLGRVFPRTLVWVNREGTETQFDSPAEKQFGAVRLSPNQRFVAAQVGNRVHLFDRESGIWSVIPGNGASLPVWSPDSESLLYAIGGDLSSQSVEVGRPQVELWDGELQFFPHSISGDGSRALGTEWEPDAGQWRLRSVALEGARAAEPLLGENDLIRRNPAISPDGNWLAYVEKTSGIDHVYVQPFPFGGRPLLVSEGGSAEAAEPVWGRTSNELFYRDGAHMVSVQLETTAGLGVKGRTPLFAVRDYYGYLNTFAAVYDYDPTTDRFLMMRQSIPDPPGTDIEVIENGFDLLNRLAPHR